MTDAHITGTFEHNTKFIGRPDALAAFDGEKVAKSAAKENDVLLANNQPDDEREKLKGAKQPATGAIGGKSGSGISPTAQKPGLFSKLMCFHPGAATYDGVSKQSSFQPSHANLGAPASAEPETPEHVEPKVFEWDGTTEYTISACIDFLETHGAAAEPRLFAVSADQDEVDAFTVKQPEHLHPHTDLHVAAAVIKDRMRHANGAFLPLSVLQAWIKATAENEKPEESSDTSSASPAAHQMPRASSAKHPDYNALSSTLKIVRREISAERADLTERLFYLLAGIASRFHVTQMSTHNLALCLAPSLLQWDPNGNMALVVLNKMMGFVAQVIEDAMLLAERDCRSKFYRGNPFYG